MLNKEPRILHISCHGIENSNISMGFNYREYKDEGNFLLLENSTGEGELVSARKLRKLITSTLELERFRDPNKGLSYSLL